MYNDSHASVGAVENCTENAEGNHNVPYGGTRTHRYARRAPGAFRPAETDGDAVSGLARDEVEDRGGEEEDAHRSAEPDGEFRRVTAREHM